MFCRVADGRETMASKRPSGAKISVDSSIIAATAARRWHGPVGDVGLIGPGDGLMAGRGASSARRQIRVVDYALQPAAIARHWVQHVLRGTDARGRTVLGVPHDVGATCSMRRRVCPVLADPASTGRAWPLAPPDAGFTAARGTVRS